MRASLRLLRVLSLIVFSVLGTSALMYVAPGYFSDVREMDAAHGDAGRRDLQLLASQQHSLASLLRSDLVQWAHGDLGESRQYGTPVAPLLRERGLRSLRTLFLGAALGWSAALSLAVAMTMRESVLSDLTVAALTAVLLALPVGVLATVCLLTDVAGPVVVLASFIAARDLKILHRMLRAAWRAPHAFQARAQGLTGLQILRVHLWTAHRRELLSVAVMSFTLALSALVPVEVIFDIPGLGQLAWSAAMNRDLPVLLAVTALMSACIGLSGSFLGVNRAVEVA